MRYELNFDEDKIIDIEAIGDNSVLDLKDCCKLLNELNEERNYFERKKCEYFNKYNKKHLDNIQLKEENEQLKQKLENLDLNEKNDTVKMIDGKVFIKM